MSKIPTAVMKSLETRWEAATIPTAEFNRLMSQIQQALEDPGHQAKLALGKMAVLTLQGYNPVNLREHTLKEVEAFYAQDPG